MITIYGILLRGLKVQLPNISLSSYVFYSMQRAIKGGLKDFHDFFPLSYAPHWFML
jgi:hypothetical protein